MFENTFGSKNKSKKKVKKDFRNEVAQTFTLESIVASLLLLVVAYFLFKSTLLIAPQSTQILDVQLSQYGKDVLRVLDNPYVQSPDTLQYTLEHLNSTYNYTPLIEAIRKCLPPNVEFNVAVCYNNTTLNKITEYKLTNNTPMFNTVTVSRCIIINSADFVKDSPFYSNKNIESESKPIVLEVKLTLWYV